MRITRLIRIGNVSDSLMNNIAVNLEAIQSEFVFNYGSQAIPYPQEIDPTKPVPTDALETLFIEYSRKNHPGEYPIAVCNCPLEDNVLTSADDEGTLISLYRLKQLKQINTTSDLVKAFMFSLVDPLLNSLGLNTPSHYNLQICPMDCWTDDPSGFQKALANSDFCANCKDLLLRAVSQERLTISQLAAIYRILDHVAGRHMCFVLMPFKPQFNRLYNNLIKPAVTNLGWTCLRSDEIYETREIINIIWENIQRAQVILADLTGKNPNVFYELGYAHAIGKNTILLSQKISDIPFDLRHRQLIEYQIHGVRRDKIRDKLSKYLSSVSKRS